MIQLLDWYFEKRIRWCKVVTIITLLFFALPVNSQSGIKEDVLKEQFVQLQNGSFREKVFVHSDKSFYVTGEILWFKLYLVDAASNIPDDISKVAYVELIGTGNTPVLQAKIELEEGKGNGSFLVPSSVATGNYVLRAYTNWMKNFGSAHFFQKPVTIVNTTKKPDWKVLEDTTKHELHFFPEGGDLVYGLESTVAFHLRDNSGKGMDGSGVLLNNANDTIARFETSKFGMGSFLFTPQVNQQYKAIVRTNDNNVLLKELPAILTEGYVMHLSESEQDNKNLVIEITSSARQPDEAIFLLNHATDKIVSAKSGKLTNGKAVFRITKEQLPDGISYLSVFDQNHRPVCERLFFKRPQKRLNILAKTDKKNYSTRDKVNIELHTSGIGDQKVDANLSISVFLIDSLQHTENENIEQYLWLTSELKGLIEQPEYYFNEEGKEADSILNLLLLTHGWRRFRQQEDKAQRKSAFEFLPEYEGHILQARITDKATNKPVEGVKVYLSSPGKKFHFNTAASDENGFIRLPLKNFHTNNGVILQMDSARHYQLTLLPPFWDKYDGLRFPSFRFSETMEKDLLLRSESSQVQHIYLNDKLYQFSQAAASDTVLFSAASLKSYRLDEFTRFPTMEEVIREYVSEARVRNEKGRYYYQVLNAPFKTFFELQPLILLDGIPVFDTDKIVNYDPLKIERIDVVPQRYNYGPSIYNGIVSYTTYAGTAEDWTLNPEAIVLEYESLQRQREFYAPLYETEAQRKSRLPDFRNVLYWTPDVNTDTLGKASFSFYTSDFYGRYVVVVQGLSSEGLAGSTVSIIEVTKPDKASR